MDRIEDVKENDIKKSIKELKIEEKYYEDL